jgi:hypothetical protein
LLKNKLAVKVPRLKSEPENFSRNIKNETANVKSCNRPELLLSGGRLATWGWSKPERWGETFGLYIF